MPDEPTPPPDAAPDPGRRPRRFGDSFAGKVAAPVVASCITGAIVYVATLAVATPPPPEVELLAPGQPVQADVPAEFGAGSTRSPAGRPLTLDWQVGGLPLGESAVANCTTADAARLLRCRFVVPGSIAVRLTATDDRGRQSSAGATVEVVLPNGYVLVTVAGGAVGPQADDVYAALLAMIDWTSLQQHVARPVLLYDPGRDALVYAASVAFDAARAAQVAGSGVLMGRTLILPPLAPPARTMLEEAVTMAGARLVPVPLENVPDALERGLGELGLLPMASPAEALRQVREGGIPR